MAGDYRANTPRFTHLARSWSRETAEPGSWQLIATIRRKSSTRH